VANGLVPFPFLVPLSGSDDSPFYGPLLLRTPPRFRANASLPPHCAVLTAPQSPPPFVQVIPTVSSFRSLFSALSEAFPPGSRAPSTQFVVDVNIPGGLSGSSSPQNSLPNHPPPLRFVGISNNLAISNTGITGPNRWFLFRVPAYFVSPFPSLFLSSF